MKLHDEATVQRLASGRKGEPAFLSAHHMAAADRLERMIARAQLAPRVTVSYDPARVGGGKGSGNGATELTDTAAEARQKLNRLARLLPADCWSVAFDVCGLGKGLQLIESERAWPRRSAKLVLRVALDQLAAQFGLAPYSAGNSGAATRAWLPDRLPLIAEPENGDITPPGSAPCPPSGCD